MFICNPVKAVNLQEATGTFTEDVAEVQEAAASHSGSQMMLFEQMPRFNGGNSREFSQWVNSHSELQGRTDVEGRMLVGFTVGSDGVVRDVKMLKGLREDIDQEVAQIISSSPRWEPGLDPSGRPVPVHYSIPIVFLTK
jgi:Gram-negative bacterial tonB protein.